MPTETLRPNAPGTNTQLTPIGASQNWDCVDETTPDDSTTYVRSPTTDDIPRLDTYNIPDSNIPAGSTISNVTIYIRSNSAHNLYRSLQRIAIRVGGVNYYCGLFAPPTEWTNYECLCVKNPRTGSAWTIADINALEIGIQIASGSNGAVFLGRCTQVYVVVTYTPPAPSVARRAFENLLLKEEWR
ncbi:MAG: hypothetical protein K6T73_08180 [Candidatus Bathyarchaeota archaeon]|nr:hypothetical protein [Candidatus Bathyarchaeota archaeon]